MSGFTWLAKTVDYIIRECETIACDNENEIVNLKTDFFRFGVYRLAGGIDNSPGDSDFPIIDVRTKTFSLQMMKFSAANMLAEPIQFESESSVLQNDLGEKGNLTIRIP